jgi:hypothetical protein
MPNSPQYRVIEGTGIKVLSHCEIGVAGLAFISYFGAIFAGFSLLASAGIVLESQWSLR